MHAVASPTSRLKTQDPFRWSFVPPWVIAFTAAMIANWLAPGINLPNNALPDFAERNGMGGSSLLELWSWTAIDFERRHEGSAIRRIGYSRWRRNLAVAIGNALRSDKSPPELKSALRSALQAEQGTADALVQEHIDWALEAPFSG
jgi:hypothetical protein